ncbi:MAG: sodium/proline symporter [Novosphingobium sp.]
MLVASFLGCMLLFLLVGLSSALRAKGTNNDYYLASHSVGPALTGLSAVATNNSGYMFIGVIGYTYVAGLSSIWLMLGWLLGDFLASLLVHRKLVMAARRTGDLSYIGALAHWNGGDMRLWRVLAALLTIAFLGAYAAAQISAGGKALHGILGWDRTTGAWLVAGMVLAYSIAGGIRASIWTDAAQSAVMMLAMATMFGAGILAIGGWEASLSQWRAIPGFFDLVPDDLLLPGAAGLVLFVVGWMFAGLSVIGQPHVMVRFMALDAPQSMWTARLWYYGFFTTFYGLATGVGLLSRLLLPDLASIDPELALPKMALETLPPWLVGVVLAGIFAATMSTADSLVLSCSAAVTQDLAASPSTNMWLPKIATAAVTGLALFIALGGHSSVFDLVILSWSTLAVAFGPMALLFAMGRQLNQPGALGVTALGVSTALLWRAVGWHDAVYEGLPGILAATTVGWALSRPRSRVLFSQARAPGVPNPT